MFDAQKQIKSIYKGPKIARHSNQWDKVESKLKKIDIQNKCRTTQPESNCSSSNALTSMAKTRISLSKGNANADIMAISSSNFFHSKVKSMNFWISLDTGSNQ